MNIQLREMISWFKNHPLPTAIVAIILFITAVFGNFPDIHKKLIESEIAEKKVHSLEKKIYRLGLGLGKQGLIYSDSAYLLSISDNALNESGLTKTKLRKLSKLAKTEILLMQSKFDRLKVNIQIAETIGYIEKQHSVAFGKTKPRDVVNKLGLLTYEDIRELHGKTLSNLFFIGFFSGISKQNGLGMFKDEYQAEYIGLAPLVNLRLKENNLSLSIKETVDEKLGIIDEIIKLEEFMASKYGNK